MKDALDDLTSSILERLATRHPEFVRVAVLAAQTRCEASALQGHLLLLNRMGLIDIHESGVDHVGSARLTRDGMRLAAFPRVRQRRQAMRRRP